MKRAAWIAAALAIAGSLIWVAAQVSSAGARPIATLFPAGPVLYVEAKDFQGLVRDWNGSKEKPLWLASSNYDVFSRSNLYLKLQQAQAEFAAAAGVPPDMTLLSNVAGAESALAIYDIGKLQFLYVARLPSARFADSALWKGRGNYEPRKSAGLDYYVRADKASERVAAFAVAQDWILLATREDVLAGALSLVASQNVPAMAAEPWYTQAVQAAKAPGELRLVLNMTRLIQSPYMRSYWIQRNASELKQYSAAISDASRGVGEVMENRLLFRVSDETAAWNENAVGQVLRLAPAGTGLYRAWASPSADQAFELIREKILEPQPGAGPEGRSAPEAGSMDSISGSEADLETRIDEAPLENQRRAMPDDIRKLLSAGRVDAMLHVGSTHVLADGVFVGIDSAIVLLRGSNWDVNAAKSALAASGAQLEGLAPIGLAANGPLLVIATRPELAQSILAGVNRPAQQPARYAAAYQHDRELPNFEKLTRLIDNPLKSDAPMFFSQNAASFGRSMLGRVDSASILVHDTGSIVSQNLVYKLKP